MKNYACILIITFLLVQTGLAQNTFEGKIVFQFANLDSSKVPFPAEHVAYYKGNKFKYEIKTVNGGMREMIIDSQAMHFITFNRASGNRNYAVTYKLVNNPSINKETTTTLLSETKVISGYTCKKALIKTKGLGTMEVYYTSEIGSREMNYNTPYSEIDGTVLEQTVTLEKGGKYIVTSTVIKESVADAKLSVPADFTLVTSKEWKEIAAALRKEQGKK